MNIQAKLWAGSHVQMLCKHEPSEIKRMQIVALKLAKYATLDDLTPAEIELRDELQAWLDARNKEYEC